MLNCSEITLMQALEYVQKFLPIKIVFNDYVLYNDYDYNNPDDDGMCGETLHPMIVVPQRLKSALDEYNVYVDSIDIRIVQHHHSIVYFKGRKVKKDD